MIVGRIAEVARARVGVALRIPRDNGGRGNICFGRWTEGKAREVTVSETYSVIVSGIPELRELTFEFEPRVGDLVRLPDLDGDLHMRVQEVVHSARLPHSNHLPSTRLTLVPQGTKS